MKCEDCQAYVFEHRQCHRYPRMQDYVKPDYWCLEHRPKEVIICPVEEKVKESEVKVEEKAVSEPIKRGWPKGKPRKYA